MTVCTEGLRGEETARASASGLCQQTPRYGGYRRLWWWWTVVVVAIAVVVAMAAMPVAVDARGGAV